MAKHRPTLLALLLGSAARVWAQEDALGAAFKPVYTVVPRVAVTETFTDNVNHTDSIRRADQITEVSPGIRITRDSGRVTGYFDYALRALGYAQGGQASTYLHALNSAGQADLIDQWLRLDFSGSVSQQSLSALEPLTGAGGYPSANSANSANVSRFSVAPSVQGTWGDAVDYGARVGRTTTHADTAMGSDVGETQMGLNLSSSNTLGRIGWVADASRYNVDYSAGRATEADQVDLGLSLAITPQLSVVAKAGREFSNYTTPDKQSYQTRDISLRWQPSPRTQATASWGQRSFGDVHAASLVYQTPLVTVRLADRRDVAAVPGQVLPVLLRPQQPLAVVPPVPGTPVIGYFLTTALVVQDRQDLELVLQGVRNTVRMSYSQSDNSRLDSLSQTQDELARSALHQRGLSLDFSHQLTPRYSVDLLAALQKTRANPIAPANQPAAPQAAPQDSQLRELGVSLTGKLWRNGRASIGMRRASFTGATPYEENALVATLSVEF